jgi:hypothetical protein
MANIIKNYTLSLEHCNFPIHVALFFKNKPIIIEYECTWNSDEGYYQPINLNITKVTRMIDKGEEVLELKNTWDSSELPNELKIFLESGLKIHAESQIDRPFVVE